MILRTASLALIGCATLAACAGPVSGARLAPITPTEQFTARVEPSADEIQLAPHGELSSAQGAALAALVMRWRDLGEGGLVIQSTADPAAARTAQAASGMLQARGVPASAIRFAAIEGDASAPVRVGFMRYVAVGPHCAHLWGDLVRTASNQPQNTFGCSTTANMAAQLVNPRDLVAAEAVTPSDSRRRVLKLNSHHAGEEPVREGSGSR